MLGSHLLWMTALAAVPPAIELSAADMALNFGLLRSDNAYSGDRLQHRLGLDGGLWLSFGGFESLRLGLRIETQLGETADGVEGLRVSAHHTRLISDLAFFYPISLDPDAHLRIGLGGYLQPEWRWTSLASQTLGVSQDQAHHAFYLGAGVAGRIEIYRWFTRVDCGQVYVLDGYQPNAFSFALSLGYRWQL